MYDKFYAIENGVIVGEVKRGGEFNGTLLGKDMPDSEYIALGLYGVYSEIPTITEYQKLGNKKQIIDDTNKTVTDTFEIIDFTQSEIDEIENNRILSALRELDIQSIRAIREYISSKPDAPQILKDKESAAVDARSRLKP